MITVTAFKWVPPFAQGLVRDLRVRWALKEAGLPYQVRLIGFEDQATPAYRAQQPFGQVPVLEEDGLVLFESAAIVLHVAERSETLLPVDPVGRERARAWVIAAINSMEPAFDPLGDIDLFHPDEDWAKARRPQAEEAVLDRLDKLAAWLGDRDYLEDRFTVGDLMMTTVLRNLRHTDLVQRFMNLDAYKQRCEARPAFQRALAEQMATFEQHAPAAA
jgi:glutathione S-transferase